MTGASESVADTEGMKSTKAVAVTMWRRLSVATIDQVGAAALYSVDAAFFRKSKEEIIDIAVTGAKLCKEYREKYGL